jgi:hypothetical protein
MAIIMEAARLGEAVCHTSPLLSCESWLTKHTCFQPRIAECSAWVEPLD